MSKDLRLSPQTPTPTYEAWLPFDDLMKLDPADGEQAEAIRLKHCLVCRRTCGAAPLDRAHECDEAGCTLRDPERLAEEREWLNYITRVLWLPNYAPQEAIDLFNSYLLTCSGGMRVSLLGTYGTGRHGLSFHSSTFRAAAQQGALLILAHRAGYRHMNIGGLTQEVLTKLVLGWWREYRNAVKQAAVGLRQVDEPVSWAKIIKFLGPDAPTESTLKDWYKEATDQIPSARRRKKRGEE